MNLQAQPNRVAHPWSHHQSVINDDTSDNDAAASSSSIASSSSLSLSKAAALRDEEFNEYDYRLIARIIHNTRYPTNGQIEDLKIFFQKKLCVHKMSDLDYQNSNELMVEAGINSHNNNSSPPLLNNNNNNNNNNAPDAPNAADDEPKLTTIRGNIMCLIRIQKFLDYGSQPGVVLNSNLTLKTIDEAFQQQRKSRLLEQNSQEQSCQDRQHAERISFRTVTCGLCNTNEKTHYQTEKRKLTLQLSLLRHASSCTRGWSCPIMNCFNMRECFNHIETCKEKWPIACVHNKRLAVLLQAHARKCKDEDCPVPQCTMIRRPRNKR